MKLTKKIYSRTEKFFILAKKSFFIAWYRHHFIIPPRVIYKYAKSFVVNLRRGNGMSNMYTNQKMYLKWYGANMQNLDEDQIKEFKYKPKFSFVMPCYDISENFLRECIDSLLFQSYKNFEIVICEDACTSQETLDCLASYGNKIKLIHNKKNMNISGATNNAIKNTTGDFIVLVDNDDVVHKDALYYLCEALNKDEDIDFLYTDEDKIDFNGKLKEPNFKPDFAPDTFLTQNYFNHLTCIRKSLLDQVGLMRPEFDGAQDYDLYLRVIEKTKNIKHIDKVLYHWRVTANSTSDVMDNKSFAIDAGRRAIQDYLSRKNIDAQVSVNDKLNTYLVKYMHDNPKLSIIIPMHDGVDVTKRCVDSLFNVNTYKNFEIIIGDNRSQLQETKDYLEQVQKQHDNIKVMTIDEEFNYSRINNKLIEQASGDFLLLLNNDTEVISPDFIDWMIGYARQEHVGCVGLKLLYPNDHIQHAGVVLGYGGVAGHIHVGKDCDELGLFGQLVSAWDFSAVTAACLMIDKNKFFGFDENLKVALNDVDLCINVLSKGFYNVCLNNIVMHHYESKSRGYDDSKEKHERYLREQKYMKDKWGKFIKKDKFLSKYYF